jgi:protein O-GlcNAc transferase
VELELSKLTSVLQIGSNISMTSRLTDQKSNARSEEDVSEALSLGWQLLHRHKFDEAEMLCRDLLSECPEHAETLFLYGMIQWKSGTPADAIPLLRQAIALQPQQAILHNVIGLIFNEMNRYSEAIVHFLKALTISSDYVDARCNLGLSYFYMHHYSRAADCFERVLDSCPTHAASMANLGMVRLAQGYEIQATAAYENAIALDPKQSRWWGNLAAAYLALNQYSKSVSSYTNAISLDTEKNVIHFIGLGTALRAMGDWQASIEILHEAIAIAPDNPEAISNLYIACQHACQWDALESLHRKLDHHTRYALNTGERPAEQPMGSIRRSMDLVLHQAVAQAWSRQAAYRATRTGPPFCHQHDKLTENRIIIGYLSYDFRDHPVAHQLSPLFGMHDRHRFKVIVFSSGPDDGSRYRNQIQNECDLFVDIQGKNMFQAAQEINSHGVDILIDLMGHSQDSYRMGMLALRPAPLQVSYLGFLATTGADFIDYLIADSVVVSQNHLPYYNEKIIWMPNCYQMVPKWMEATDVPAQKRSDWDLPDHGFVFCSFNQSYKINARMFDRWMWILKQAPYSVLWLYDNHPMVVSSLKRAAEQKGIDPDRLIFGSKVPLPLHLARLQLADLMLDTDIYNGGATTANALAAGVPVVSMMGNHWVSRMTASHLIAAGLPELVCLNLDTYEQTAVDLALFPQKAEALHEKLIMNHSLFPLFNVQGFVNDLDNALEMIWHRHVQDLKPDHIHVPPSAYYPQFSPVEQ